MRLLIADDHPLIIDGLKAMLAGFPDTELLEPANNGRQLLDKLYRQKADIVILDLNMPQMDGMATLRILKRDFPRLKVIIFTNYNHAALIEEIVKLGADGYLLKTSDANTFKQAVLSVWNGQKWFPDLRQKKPEMLVDNFSKLHQLTPREVEIVRLVASGRTTKQIALQLFVSDFTINAHRRNIARKLDISTPLGWLQFAQNSGLLTKSD